MEAQSRSGRPIMEAVGSPEVIKADMVLLAIGVTPDTYLAKEAGLELASGAASLSTSGWKPPCRTSMLWAMP